MVEVQFEGDTSRLNRQQIAQHLDSDIKTIGKNINNIFNEDEHDKN